MAFIYGNELLGTTSNDLLAGRAGVSNINGDDYPDVIIGDTADSFDIRSAGHTISTASSLDTDSWDWRSDENPLLFDNGVTPYLSFVEFTQSGSSDYYSIQLTAGQTITLDVDFGGDFSNPPTVIEIMTFSGTILASDNGSMTNEGGLGSISANDPLLSFTAPTTGTYYIHLHPAGAADFDGNHTFTLNVSVSGHALSGTAPVVGGNDTLLGGFGDDQIGGGGGNDLIGGNEGNDWLIGGTGNDELDGGSGNDRMEGGPGDDLFYVDSPLDDVIESADQGTDVVVSSISLTLAENIENLTLIGSAPINGSGNSLDNVIVGNSANNVLDGVAGADSLAGGDGDDTYYVDDVADEIIEQFGEGMDRVSSSVSFTLSANVENLTLTGSNAINGVGNALNNNIDGNSGANILNGGAGADILFGGFGDDTYIIDNAGDAAIEIFDAGADLVKASVSFTLGENFENLTLTGTAAINGTGNDLANSITGNSASNVIDGGAGGDIMFGGDGNDTYVVDNAGDRANEASATGGIDKVNSSVTFALGANVENLTLTGSAAINGSGNGLANTITGNSANNVLNGGAGADIMSGGLGDDIYVVDNASDRALESSATGGIDKVNSSVTFALGANVENLTLTGSAAINGTGNSLANIIAGNSADNVLNGGGGADTLNGNAGADTLNGGTGADTMKGGLGNDTYIVDNVGDRAIEGPLDDGIDLVQSSVTFTLGGNVENLTLTGSAAIDGTGNVLANVITGNAANNVLRGGDGADTLNGDAGADTLNGGTGADTMKGGVGNDTYIVDDAGDRAIEGLDGGTDLVQSSVTFTLGGNVENLTLTGSAAINGTGNGLANILIGNSGNNVLSGNDGADTLNGGAGTDSLSGGGGADWLFGGAGNDSLSGGAGGDLFCFDTLLNASNNVDQITDFRVVDDTVQLDDDIFTAVGAVGTLSTNAFYTGAAAQDADDRIIYDSANGNIYYDADGNGPEAQVLFAHVTPGLTLTNADFQIVG